MNSAGIQMGRIKNMWKGVFSDPDINILAMSLLGGGVLDPAEEIPRAFQFPAIVSGSGDYVKEKSRSVEANYDHYRRVRI